MGTRQVRFTFQVPEDYAPAYANGCYGGIGPRGELMLHFFLEHSVAPSDERHLLSESGQLLENVPPEEEQRGELLVVRQVVTGVVLNLDTARRVHSWLGDRISDLEKAEGAARG